MAFKKLFEKIRNDRVNAVSNPPTGSYVQGDPIYGTYSGYYEDDGEGGSNWVADGPGHWNQDDDGTNYWVGDSTNTIIGYGPDVFVPDNTQTSTATGTTDTTTGTGTGTGTGTDTDQPGTDYSQSQFDSDAYYAANTDVRDSDNYGIGISDGAWKHWNDYGRGEFDTGQRPTGMSGFGTGTGTTTTGADTTTTGTGTGTTTDTTGADTTGAGTAIDLGLDIPSATYTAPVGPPGDLGLGIPAAPTYYQGFTPTQVGDVPQIPQQTQAELLQQIVNQGQGAQGFQDGGLATPVQEPMPMVGAGIASLQNRIQKQQVRSPLSSGIGGQGAVLGSFR